MTPAQLQAARLIHGIAPTYSYQLDPNEWCIKEFLVTMASLYHTDISLYDDADGIEALVTEFGISVVTLYNQPHDSDELCSVEMLLANDLPLAGWKRIGDHGDYSHGVVVFNDAQGRDLAMRVWERMRKTDVVGSDGLDVLGWAFQDNQYMHPIKNLQEDEVAYAMNNPHWMQSRKLDTRNCVLYALNEDNTLARIKDVISTTMSANAYGRDKYHRTTVEMEDGTQAELETDTIVHTPLRKRP